MSSSCFLSALAGTPTRFGSTFRTWKILHSSVFPGGSLRALLVLLHSSLKLAYVRTSPLNLGHDTSVHPMRPQSLPALLAGRRTATYGTGQALPCLTTVDHSDPVPLPPGPHQVASSDCVKACLYLSPKSGLHTLVATEWSHAFKSLSRYVPVLAMSHHSDLSLKTITSAIALSRLKSSSASRR
jgi:hypothetical protein